MINNPKGKKQGMIPLLYNVSIAYISNYFTGLKSTISRKIEESSSDLETIISDNKLKLAEKRNKNWIKIVNNQLKTRELYEKSVETINNIINEENENYEKKKELLDKEKEYTSTRKENKKNIRKQKVHNSKEKYVTPVTDKIKSGYHSTVDFFKEHNPVGFMKYHKLKFKYGTGPRAEAHANSILVQKDKKKEEKERRKIIKNYDKNNLRYVSKLI
ncbi:hypothetical protein ACFLTH_07280 [Bacteroidota bacterium]